MTEKENEAYRVGWIAGNKRGLLTGYKEDKRDIEVLTERLVYLTDCLGISHREKEQLKDEVRDLKIACRAADKRIHDKIQRIVVLRHVLTQMEASHDN